MQVILKLDLITQREFDLFVTSVTELDNTKSYNKLSDNNLASELGENKSFSNQS